MSLGFIPTDYYQYEFDTDLSKDGDEYVAKSMGREARDKDQSVAISKLNQQLQDAIFRGDLIQAQ